jgi:hypothetical protein
MDVSGQLHAPATLHPGKDPRYSLDRRPGETQGRSGRGGEEKNSQSPPEIEPKNSDRPASSLIVIPSELSRLMDIYNKIS